MRSLSSYQLQTAAKLYIFQFGCLFFSFFLIAPARTSSTMLNRSGKTGHPSLSCDLRGKAFSLSPLSMMFSGGFHVWLLLC